MRQLALVVNPAAGHGRGQSLTPLIERRLTDAGVRLVTTTATSPEHARDACASAVASGVDGLVVVGGDGMAHIGVNACAHSGVPLGVVPAGTGNDFCRGVGIPTRSADALDVVLAGRTRTIDLTRVTGGTLDGQPTHVGCVVSTGFDERVNRRANKQAFDLGAPSYLWAVLAELRSFSALRYRLTLDGEPRELDAMLVAVANVGIFGGGIRIAPAFDLTDGLLDVTIVHEVSRLELLTLLPRLRGRNFVRHPALEYLRARSVVVDGVDLRGMADGEPLGVPPLTCTVAPAALTVMAAP